MDINQSPNVHEGELPWDRLLGLESGTNGKRHSQQDLAERLLCAKHHSIFLKVTNEIKINVLMELALYRKETDL